MPATNATLAKLALLDRLKAEADGGLLAGVEVHYAYHGNVGPKSLYGGGWRMTAEQDVAEQAGILVRELVTVSLYVRIVARPPTDVEETDVEADRIAGIISRIFRHDPQLAGPLAFLGIAGGQGDYSRLDDETVSVHAYQVQVGSHLSYG
jgi:hypothetical protein